MEAQLVHRAPSVEPPASAAAPSTAAAPKAAETPEQHELAPRESSTPASASPEEPVNGSAADHEEHPVEAPADSPILELAPLPTEFDPDATPPPPLPPKDEEDELAFEPHPDPEPEPEPEHQAETNYDDNPELYRSLAVLTQYDDGEDQTGMEVDYEHQPEQVLVPPAEPTEVIEETVSQEHQVEGGDQPPEETVETESGANGEADDIAMDVEHPPEQQEDREESPLREPSLNPSSPLSDIPDLPQEIDFSEQKPKEPTPPPLKRKPSRAGSEADEGSASKKKKTEPEEQGPSVKPARAARSRKRLDAQLNIIRDMAPPPEKVAPRAKTLTDGRILQMLKGKTRDVQLTPCLRPRYGVWGKCVQCVAKLGGDSCRFRDTRVFEIDPQTGKILKPGRFEDIEYSVPVKPLPTNFNTKLTEEHMERTEETVAPVLLHPISQELRHIVKNKAIYRGTDAAEHRALCDFCASTIFGGYFFCRKCGRDYCLQCERYMSDTTDNLLTSPWPLPDAAKPRLHKCSRGGDDTLPLEIPPAGRRVSKASFQHARCDLQPASRFRGDELKEQWKGLMEFVLQPGADVDETIKALTLDGDEDLEKAVRDWFENQPPPEPKRTHVSDAQLAELYEASKSAPSEKDPAGLDTHPFMYIDADKLDNEVFDDLWARGEPLVAYGTKKRFRGNWTPDMFIDRYGHDGCWVLDCQDEKFYGASIRSFFTLFKVLGREESVPTQFEAMELDDEDEQPRPKKGEPVKPPDNVRVFLNQYLEARKAAEQAATESEVATEANSATPAGDGPATDSSEPPEGDKSRAPANGDSGDKDMAPEPETTTPSSPATGAIPADGQSHGEGLPVTESSGERSVSRSTTPAQAHGSESFPEKPPAEVESLELESNGQKAAPRKRKPKPMKILKLKDWPIEGDFETNYPDMYHDFSDALPVPDYTRRNGVLNLYSHFPAGATRPDIGPKMYNAFAAREDPGGMGSTRLHMDVADAINIQLHASPGADGQPGCAVWDLFRAEDADKIRQFLMEKFDKTQYKYQDPIHAQMFYLDSALRTELYDKYGVKSFRVYQYPGDAVFIPAGCAHQVCNLANCIKIALDFVSPHNVRRCQRLGQDFRQENFVRAWKDDVLQLYNVLWYAWTNVRETRQRRKDEAAAFRAREAERTAQYARWESGTVTPRFGAATSSVRDETPTSTKSPSKEPEPAPTGPTRAELKQSLVDRLMAAAIEREPMPVPAEEEKKRAPTPPPAPQRARISQAVANNDLMMGLAMKVIQSDMGKGMGDMDE